jgi:hypothetical protein
MMDTEVVSGTLVINYVITWTTAQVNLTACNYCESIKSLTIFIQFFNLIENIYCIIWGTMLQAGRSQGRFPKRSLDFSTDLILPNSLWPWGWLSLFTEMSTRNLPRGKGRLAHKADNLTAFCEPLIYKMWERRCVTTLWASMTCYRESFTFFYYKHKQ